MTTYKENLSEIPLDKHDDTFVLSPEDFSGAPTLPENGLPAYNAGVLEIKCLINNKCPFAKRERYNDVLLLNKNTMNPNHLKFNFPADVPKSIEFTGNLDGMHFKRRYVYRHTYLSVEPRQAFDGSTPPGQILDIRPESNDAKFTKYRNHQTFVLTSNVFNTDFVRPDETSGQQDYSTGEIVGQCPLRTEWAYNTIPKPSEASMQDMEFDYLPIYLDTFIDGWTSWNGFTLTYRPNKIQLPMQNSVSSCFGSGTHWRVKKLTPLYRGEDFFVDFIRGAPSDDLPVFEKAEDRPTWSLSEYDFLDASKDPKLNMIYIPNWEKPIPINSGVIIITEDENGEIQSVDNKTFDFTDQPYYIIELGHKDTSKEKHWYFIIICHRAVPRCVRVDENGICHFVGDCEQNFTVTGTDGGTNNSTPIRGENLLALDNLRVTIRNHLGMLAVYFDGPGITMPDPWIIQRYDDEIEEGKMVKKKKVMFVQEGTMCIWGGNRACGFSFGPLQYYHSTSPGLTDQGAFRFELPSTPLPAPPPPIPAEGETETAPDNRPFFTMPQEGPHSILLSTSTEPMLEVPIEQKVPNESINSLRMYTCDAQYVGEWIETIEKDTINPSKQTFEIDTSLTDSFHQGNFFYRKDPLKAFVQDFGSFFESDFDTETRDFNTPVWTDSSISVRKHELGLDPSGKQKKFYISVSMKCGHHIFLPLPSESDPSPSSYVPNHATSEWLLWKCKTPVITQIIMHTPESPFPRWGTTYDDNGTPLIDGVPAEEINPLAIDATPYVLSFRDSWSAQDFFRIEHSGSIELLLEKVVSADNTEQTVNKLYDLRDKGFYIEVWAGYKESPGADCDAVNYSGMPGLYKIFTGLCFGGEISYSYGKRTMSCKIYDYTKILKDQMFFNSPFYDGVRGILAVREILQFAGFRSFGAYDPMRLMDEMAKTAHSGDFQLFQHVDDRVYASQGYALPHGYNLLQQPQFRFEDASSYYDGIAQIAEKEAKCFYFDQFGIAHFEAYFDVMVGWITGDESLVGDGDLNALQPLFWFTTNPVNWMGQLVFNSSKVMYPIEDVYNHIKIVSNTPDYALIIADDVDWSTYNDPTQRGFVGYLKPYYQEDGIFGSLDNTRKLINYYRSFMFKPGSVVNFETYGQPLRALDIISFNAIRMRVMKVDNEIDATKNRWWQKVECERQNAPTFAMTSREKLETFSNN